MYALEHRRELSRRWEWMLVSGIIDLVLAGIIFTGLPGTACSAGNALRKTRQKLQIRERTRERKRRPRVPPVTRPLL
jgi:hypothetical protein